MQSKDDGEGIGSNSNSDLDSPTSPHLAELDMFIVQIEDGEQHDLSHYKVYNNDFEDDVMDYDDDSDDIQESRGPRRFRGVQQYTRK